METLFRYISFISLAINPPSFNNSQIVGERKLRLAANTNDLDRLKTLLDSGIDPKSCDEFLRTALHLAASKGYTEVVR